MSSSESCSFNPNEVHVFQVNRSNKRPKKHEAPGYPAVLGPCSVHLHWHLVVWPALTQETECHKVVSSSLDSR